MTVATARPTTARPTTARPTTSRPWRTARSTRALLVAFFSLALVAGCSSGDDSSEADGAATSTSAAQASSTTTTEPQLLTILVSNDDGYAAPGIDAVARALSALPDTEVVVVAPKENQSGSGSKTTDGELVTEEVTTASGIPAVAVAGYPADSVVWALDGGIDVTPDLVITGINSGQNLGAIGDELSGTLGAARAGAARGIPALATSAALNDAVDYDLAATFVVDWVTEHRAALLAGELTGEALLLENLNVPVCTTGELRGVARVPMSTSTEGALELQQDCTSTLADPPDDIVAFNNGFVSLSSADVEPPG